MTAQSCTYGGATSASRPCTPVGATSGGEIRPTLHLFLCNIGPLNLVPPSVQHTLHPRWFNNEYPYLLTHSRHALACKTDVSIYRNFTTNPVDLPDHQRNNRPRTRRGGQA